MKISDENGLVAFANYGKNDFSTPHGSFTGLLFIIIRDIRNWGQITAVEDDVKEHGGKILWIETSGRPLYAQLNYSTKNGYKLHASLKEFYGPGDPKQIYAKFF